MGTKEEQSIEELGAEVSTSVLTPLRFLERSARVWEDRPAVVVGKQTWTYAEHDERVRRAAAARARRARDRRGRPRRGAAARTSRAMLELHYAVPGVGGVLVPLNTRLAAPEYDYILEHCGAKVLVADAQEASTSARALGTTRRASSRVDGEVRGAASPAATRSTRSSAPTTSAR